MTATRTYRNRTNTSYSNNSNRTNSAKRRKQLQCRRTATGNNGCAMILLKKVAVAACILMACVLCAGPVGRLFTGNSGVVEANQPIGRLCYKTVQIQPGDSLWTIAEDNMNGEFDNIHEYINEITECNQLECNQITAGNYLMIPYYEYE